MGIFPSSPELILIAFTALLSFVSSFFLLKIKNPTEKAVKKLEEDRKILIAGQEEVKKLLHGKLISSEETQDAKKFMEKEAVLYLAETRKKITEFGNRDNKPLYFGIGLIGFVVGSAAVLCYAIISDSAKINTGYIVVGSGIIFSLIYFWLIRKSIKKYRYEILEIENRLDYFDREINRASDILKQNR
ncbi:MAG: hypothetical protein QY332_17795 [Anaerolineales bacterium]|nr:MAG: hypothetical protein QY332_17795 [Anaerolineales bacterium]